MSMSIRAIDTIYPYPNGHRFRSRTEAYWAVFFDLMGIEYKYEIQGYKVDDTCYLPDFWLPSLRPWPTFLEVKGRAASFDELFLCERLAVELEQNTCLFVGYPWNVTTWYRWHVSIYPGGIKDRIASEAWMFDGYNTDIKQIAYLDHRKHVGRSFMTTKPFWQRNLDAGIDEWWLNSMPSTGHNINSHGFSKFLWNRDIRSSYAVRKAAQIARQVRFEHGEQPRRHFTPSDAESITARKIIRHN